MGKQGKILIVDDNADILSAARIFLKRHFLQVDTEKSPDVIPNILMNETYDVILLDMNFTRDVSSGQEGFFWLDKILDIDPAAVVVLITAYGDVELAVRAIKEGATDFVMKPWENEKLLATVSSAMKLRETRLENESLRRQNQQYQDDLAGRFKEIIGDSPAMQKVYETIEAVATTDANVLILGENGTGKELVARAIHRKSKRLDKPFVSVDLGAITESLFESELFGHKKGAFTDAQQDRIGRFQIADTGTLFLDEIGNLSLPSQAKLLTAIQNKQIHKVGQSTPIDVDIRIISATNRPLYQMVEDSGFRQDLLYRINTIEIKLPALRERKSDIPLLAEHFLKIFSEKYEKNIRSLSESLIKRMSKYHWPGNIRELQHAMERAVIMSKNQVLDIQDFFNDSSGKSEQDSLSLEEYNIEDMERILIRKALQKHNGNISKASAELGLTRSSLYRRMEKYGI